MDIVSTGADCMFSKTDKKKQRCQSLIQQEKRNDGKFLHYEDRWHAFAYKWLILNSCLLNLNTEKADPWSRSHFSSQKSIQHEVVLLRPMRRKLHGIKTLSLSSLDSRSEHAGICRSGVGGHACKVSFGSWPVTSECVLQSYWDTLGPRRLFPQA